MTNIQIYLAIGLPALIALLGIATALVSLLSVQSHMDRLNAYAKRSVQGTPANALTNDKGNR